MTLSNFLKLSSRQKETGLFVKGDEQEGDWCQWYPNNQLATICHYKNGIYNGEYIFYYDNGQIDTKCTYVNGKLDG